MRKIQTFIAFCSYTDLKRESIVKKAVNSRPLVIAHRGGCGYLPENTLEANVMSYVMGADFLEFDLVLTQDNIPIVLHDLYLDEITDVSKKFSSSRARDDGHYYAIDFTLKEIKTLRVTGQLSYSSAYVAKFPKRFPIWQSSFQINTLRELIELVKGLEKSFKQSFNFKNRFIGIYPEIKKPYFHNLENRKNFSEIVLNILTEFNYKTAHDPVFLQCADPFELIKIRKVLHSNLKLVQLIGLDSESDNRINYTFWRSIEGLERISSFAQAIGPSKDLLVITTNNNTKYLGPSELSFAAKKFDLLIHPYTIAIDDLPPYVQNYNELLEILINNICVDGVITSFPDLMITFLLQHNQLPLM